MLANHTSIRHLFNRTLSQFDKLFKRNAFVDNYKVCACPRVCVRPSHAPSFGACLWRGPGAACAHLQIPRRAA